eukprot:SAG11_NODE_1530_length_4737_cov_3.232643_3_plen_119_part_00
MLLGGAPAVIWITWSLNPPLCLTDRIAGMLVNSLLPLLHGKAQDAARGLLRNYAALQENMLEAMWARKLGLSSFGVRCVQGACYPSPPSASTMIADDVLTADPPFLWIRLRGARFGGS